MSEAGRYSRSILFPGIGERGRSGSAALDRLRRRRRGRRRGGGGGVARGVRAPDDCRPRRGRALESLPPVSLRRRGRGPDRSQGRRGGGEARRDRSGHPGRAVVADLDASNALEILGGHDVIFDGSDNFETRLLVSDAARSLGPAVDLYAACVGEEGRVAVLVPGKTPCLRCYLESLPPAGSGPTCDTVGVVPTLPPLVAALAMSEALSSRRARSRAGNAHAVGLGRRLSLAAALRGGASSPACPVCARRPVPGARRGGGVRAREALRPPIGPGDAVVALAARFRASREATLAARPRPAVPAAPERRGRGRQPERVPRRALRRARNGGPDARALAVRPLHRELTVRRIGIEELLASPRESTSLRRLLRRAARPRSRPRRSTASRPIHLDAAGVQRVRALKRRGAASPFLVLVADRPQLDALGVAAPAALLDRYFALWPAPLTVIVPLRAPIPASLGAFYAGRPRSGARGASPPALPRRPAHGNERQPHGRRSCGRTGRDRAALRRRARRAGRRRPDARRPRRDAPRRDGRSAAGPARGRVPVAR